MKTLLASVLLTLMVALAGCQKDGVFPHPAPTVQLQVEWIPPKSFILTGETTEVCDRGFIISGRSDGKIGDQDVVVLPYDIAGIGRFTKEITLTSGVKVYIRAWATKGKVEITNYSEVQSFETW